MGKLAVIGGSGFADLKGLEVLSRDQVTTPYGLPSAPVIHGVLGDLELLFLPRHGAGHGIPPHRINYPANIWALKASGAERILGLAAVGGIGEDYGPGIVAVPRQLIDYTYGRDHSFHHGDGEAVVHIDFTYPYCESLRRALVAAAVGADIDVVEGGTYAITQGPRLETAAEVSRLERDGCDFVGMTGMPEAALAREIGVCYACCAFVVNWAAGKTEGEIITEEIEANIRLCSAKVERILLSLPATLQPRVEEAE